MPSSRRSPFRWRSFVTSGLALSFLVAAVSGVVLFVRPEGSLARWVGWSVLGADKKQWEALHIASVVLLIALSAVHAWYNWRPLLAALSTRLSPGRRGFGLGRETAAAAALVGVLAAASLLDWQPISAINDLRASIKDGKFTVVAPPPDMNADELSLRDVCVRLDLPTEKAVANAKGRGIVIGDPSKTLGAIAEEVGLSPEAVYRAITGEAGRPVVP
ncbi:MAG TPA: DUF4405 domain-containing protein [Vicinamibacterales bacterium]|nr:DUF4405 domain-containing protein [Vicinamibacterales bacterium]